MLVVLTLVPLLVTNAMAQIPGTGPCKGSLKPMEDFDYSQILGPWFEYARYPTYDYRGRCKREYYSEYYGGVQITRRQLSNMPFDFRIDETTFIIKSNGSKLTWVAPADSPKYNRSAFVLSTDYESYMVKGNCMNAGPSSLNYAWILTRSPIPCQDVLTKVQNVLHDQGIPEEYFIKMDQNDCPRYL